MVEKVREIINKWDPIDLMAHAPTNEYEVEINALCEVLKNCNETKKLAEMIINIFTHQFGSVFNRPFEECLNIASKIMEIR